MPKKIAMLQVTANFGYFGCHEDSTVLEEMENCCGYFSSVALARKCPNYNLHQLLPQDPVTPEKPKKKMVEDLGRMESIAVFKLLHWHDLGEGFPN